MTATPAPQQPPARASQPPRHRAVLAAGLLILITSGYFMHWYSTQGTGDFVPQQQPFQVTFSPDAAAIMLGRLGPDTALVLKNVTWDSGFIFGYVLIGLGLATWAFRKAIRATPDDKELILKEGVVQRTTIRVVFAAGFHDVVENAALAFVLYGYPLWQPLVFVAATGKLILISVALGRIAWQADRPRLAAIAAEIRDACRVAAGFLRRLFKPANQYLDLNSKVKRVERFLGIDSYLKKFEELITDEAAQLSSAKAWLKVQAGEAPVVEEPAQAAPADPAVPPAAAPPPGRPQPFTFATGTSGEPWVRSSRTDRLGLALSGGGIRSATFNLGLLQAMASLGVLRHVDYLSTVSGGGYIAGFWMRWLTRRARSERGPGPAHFPAGDDARSGGDRSEVRHLREFSRFLLPRAGVFRNEFWSVVMTLLGGLLPSLVFAVAIVALAWTAWYCLVERLLRSDGQSVRLLALVVTALLATLEWRGLRANALPGQMLKGGATDERRPLEFIGYLVGAELIIVIVAMAWGASSIHGLATSDGVATPVRWIAPGMPLAVAALGLLILRPVLGRALREYSGGVSIIAGVERSLSRLLGIMAFMMALGLLWWGGLRLGSEVEYLASGTGILAAVFAWLRNWLFEPAEKAEAEPDSGSWRRLAGKAAHVLRRATPRILATLVWLGFLIVVASVVIISWNATQAANPGRGFWWLNAIYGATFVMTLMIFDPARVGLHEFYRSRISRCYLGASNIDGLRGERQRTDGNRSLNEHPLDDINLGDLQGCNVKPLHLVCTAANDLSGDHLANLYRGAKSAVLSANGISVGEHTASLDYLRYSAALTASAAAFNSQMGRISMNLGPPVAFLMSTLNLRLGLWVPHPQNRQRKKNYFFPGRFFLLELLGFSRANWRHLHLSDGGHFENIGIYELVRRHCRWIIASDCGADPTVAFDDLANACRRVREDFGVEIEIDTGPLRPGDDGEVRQHAVVGTIHYDGPTGADKGTIILFKPALTGDEPADLQNYNSRAKDYPHESTLDQFFDEAQWESYRRLGEHAGWSILGFAEAIEGEQYDFRDRLFTGVRERFHPSSQDHQSTFVEMSGRCAELESDLCSNGPEFLRHELFPEAAQFAAPPAAASKDEIGALSYLMRAIQIMEDVWLSCDLDRYWSHPLNEGWMNYFQRWASTPTFRRWWPVVRPIYSNGFREFAKARFGVGIADPSARRADSSTTVGTLSLRQVANVSRFRRGHAWQQFIQRRKAPNLRTFNSVFVYRMRLADGRGGRTADVLDVGFILARVVTGQGGNVAFIRAPHFFVPPALSGSGIVGRMLDALLKRYRGQVNVITVYFDSTEDLEPLGPAARDERVRQIEFFKSRGFELFQDTQRGRVVLTKQMD